MSKIGTTAVFAQVTHIGEDYAMVKLTAQVHDSNNPANHLPTFEIEVSRAAGEWLEKVGAYSND